MQCMVEFLFFLSALVCLLHVMVAMEDCMVAQYGATVGTNQINYSPAR